MRLSILYREPLSSVMGWPISHVHLIAEYLGREPAPDERIEYAIAQNSALFANANRRKDSAPAKLTDFMLFREAWKKPEPESGRYSESDKLMLKALMSRS